MGGGTDGHRQGVSGLGGTEGPGVHPQSRPYRVTTRRKGDGLHVVVGDDLAEERPPVTGLPLQGRGRRQGLGPVTRPRPQGGRKDRGEGMQPSPRQDARMTASPPGRAAPQPGQDAETHGHADKPAPHWRTLSHVHTWAPGSDTSPRPRHRHTCSNPHVSRCAVHTNTCTSLKGPAQRASKASPR